MEPVGFALRAVVRRGQRLAVLDGTFGAAPAREERDFASAIEAESAFRAQESAWEEASWIGFGEGIGPSDGAELDSSTLRIVLETPPEPGELPYRIREQGKKREDRERARQRTGHARLVEAVRAGRLVEVQALLDDGIEPAPEDSWFQPAVECAAHQGNVEAVQLLVRAGANGAIALIEAAENGHVELVGALLEAGTGVEPDAMDSDCTTALMAAARAGHLPVLELLVSAGADPDRWVGGRDALKLAREGGHQAAAEFLAARSDVSPALVTEKLFSSVECNRAEDVADLVARGADPDGRNEDGETPLIVAIQRGVGDPDTVEALLDAGADPNREDEDGWTPWALCQSMLGSPVVQETQQRIAAQLLAGGATRQGEEAVALVRGASDGDLEEVARLLRSGIHPDQGPVDASPLEAAAGAGHVEVVRLLLEHGADPSRREEGYFSPLIRAAYGGHLQVVRLLVEAGADTAAEVEGVGNAADYAAMDGHHEVVRWLEQNGSRKERSVGVRCSRPRGAAMGWGLFEEHAAIGNGEHSLLFVRAGVDAVSAALADEVEGARRFTAIENEPCTIHRRSLPVYALQLKRSPWTLVVHAMGSLGRHVFDEGRSWAEALAGGRGWRVIHASENDTDCESWFRDFEGGGSTLTSDPALLEREGIRLPGFDPYDEVGLHILGATRRSIVRVDLVECPAPL